MNWHPANYGNGAITKLLIANTLIKEYEKYKRYNQLLFESNSSNY